MAKADLPIIEALRNTASLLEKSRDYQWGHMGACNCGFLAQEISHLKKAEIHRRAMQRYGDWNEQLNDYCPTSGLLMDDLITTLITFGFTTEDLKNLEKLADGAVLRRLSPEERYLRHNVKADVVTYLRTWAAMLEEQMLKEVSITDLEKKTAAVLMPAWQEHAFH